MSSILAPVLEFARRAVREVLQPGGIAVDATAGNGHDTLFLAQTVGSDGQVHAFDVQQSALDATRERLAANNLTAHLHLVGHERMAEVVPPLLHGKVGAAMFNLGYLPGTEEGETPLITRPETTLTALDAAFALLAPSGVCTIVCYLGHAGGHEEGASVAQWCAKLDIKQARVLRYELVNKPGSPIVLYCVKKSG